MIKALLILFLCSYTLYGWDSFAEFPPLKQPYHPVSTKNPEAQEAFNLGLVGIYAFNYDQAVAYFDRASQLDPDLAMAYWGMALAIDQNLSKSVTANHAELTTTLCEKALKLSEKATEKEKRYIQALTTRFSADPRTDKEQLRINYKKAMVKLARDYPDDDDAQTLAAESGMDLLGWDLWEPSGKPKQGAEEIVQELETVLKRNPYHIGANHYYIHALEFSPFPERALMSAEQLDAMNLKDWGHLLHTPTHIYMRVGLYEKAVEDNLKAIKADEAYIAKYGLEGQYPLKYLSHNLFYLTLSYMWQERQEDAVKTVNKLYDFIEPHAKKVPAIHDYLLMPLHVLLYFHRWDDILAMTEKLDDNGYIAIFQTFARGMAYTGMGNLEKAKETRNQFLETKKAFLSARNGGKPYTRHFFYLADLILLSSIAQAEGHLDLCLRCLQEATQFQEKQFVGYSWPYPLCQTLGALMIKMGRYSEAEQVFRHGLATYQRNGRSLFGLQEALKGQNKPIYEVERDAKAALKYAKRPLTLNDL